MKHALLLAVSLMFTSSLGWSASQQGLITKSSTKSFAQVSQKLEMILKKKGFTLFAKVDHAANASKAGLKLTANTVYIFGNPKVGTPLMQDAASFGIDLPVKIQLYQHEKTVKVVYNDPSFLASRHAKSKDLPQIKKMTGALDKITDAIIK